MAWLRRAAAVVGVGVCVVWVGVRAAEAQVCPPLCATTTATTVGGTTTTGEVTVPGSSTTTTRAPTAGEANDAVRTEAALIVGGMVALVCGAAVGGLLWRGRLG